MCIRVGAERIDASCFINKLSHPYLTSFFKTINQLFFSRPQFLVRTSHNALHNSVHRSLRRSGHSYAHHPRPQDPPSLKRNRTLLLPKDTRYLLSSRRRRYHPRHKFLRLHQRHNSLLLGPILQDQQHRHFGRLVTDLRGRSWYHVRTTAGQERQA